MRTWVYGQTISAIGVLATGSSLRSSHQFQVGSILIKFRVRRILFSSSVQLRRAGSISRPILSDLSMAIGPTTRATSTGPQER